jgi:pyridoxal phosphate enzyme (YggS family)
LWQKAAALADLPIEWHQIGHLQRNKLAKTLPVVSLVHSVDSMRLLEAINRLAVETSTTVDVLLEINISAEAAKHGFSPDQCRKPLESIAEYQHVRIQGLMCMAGLDGGLAGAERDFAALRQLRDDLQAAHADVKLDELSMGMSGDFEVAIEQGATIVRVGSALFEGID